MKSSVSPVKSLLVRFFWHHLAKCTGDVRVATNFALFAMFDCLPICSDSAVHR